MNFLGLKMSRERVRGHALIFSANLIFGVNYSVSKWLLAERLTPEFLTLGRMVSACALFWMLSLFLPKEKLSWKEIGVLFVCSLCGIAGNQTLFVFGLSHTSPIDASVISAGTPIVVMVLAAIFLREPITWLKVSGVFLGAAGAVWLVLLSAPGQGATGGSSGSVAGDFFIVSACVVYSVYFVFSKPLSVTYRATTMMKWMFLFAVLVLAPLMAPGIVRTGGLLPGAAFDAKTVAAMLYVFFGATFLAYLLIPMAMRCLRPTTASMYNYVQPMVASVLAIFLAQDEFSWAKLFAAVIIFIGVYRVTKSRARRDDLTKETGTVPAPSEPPAPSGKEEK